MMSSSPKGALALATPLQEHVDRTVADLLRSLPHIERLTSDERRGIIARYTAVLEGNFIYWMTGAYLAAGTGKARNIILNNLKEEVRDCHPAMLRKFALAAAAFPGERDALAVSADLMNVRLFVGRLPRAGTLAMMTFFENFIQHFMPYLADLAQQLGSTEQEYTEVHGVCDISHTQDLYRALEAELALPGCAQEQEILLEGVETLANLIRRIITG
jgi:hypothetical protein